MVGDARFRPRERKRVPNNARLFFFFCTFVVMYAHPHGMAREKQKGGGASPPRGDLRCAMKVLPSFKLARGTC